jgi:hypothetical protein
VKRNLLKFVSLLLLLSASLVFILEVASSYRPCFESDIQDNVGGAKLVAFDPYFNHVNQIQELHFAPVAAKR